MIARKLLSMGILGALALPFLTGCGATTQIMQLEMRDLKNRLAHLESEFGRHEESIREIRTSTQAAPAIQPAPAEALPVVNPWSARSERPAEQPRRPMTTRDVQKALRNVGANPGPIDGKMGRRTRAALRAYQRRNGLAVSGRADRQTRHSLSDHL